MTAYQIFRLIEDKLIPLALLILSGVAFKIHLPDAYAEAIGAAGLIAFQVKPNTSVPSQS